MKDKDKRKPWGGRFMEGTDRLVEAFNTSIPFDRRLFRHDIRGSIAHARALAKAGIIGKGETRKIIRGLTEIEREIEAGEFTFSDDMEDIHMAVEGRLIEKIGHAGGKLHTGRSRNDQVALDMRLYLREEIEGIEALITDLQLALLDVAENHTEAVLPGYTHLQRAQPVLLAHHLLAYYEALKRDNGRFADCMKRLNRMPLGAGALGGCPYPIDRDSVAKELGFKGVTANSMDSVSDRDFCIEFCGAASILMVHLSRLSEELVVWSSQEFAFVELSDAFSTGSSIMPQKKNPDVPELVRGKTGRVYGNLMALLTVMKALPLAYNKDMQEDKEPLFDTVDTVKGCLAVLAPMLKTMKINSGRMLEATRDGFLTATDAADYLVKRGVPFREAHHITGQAVAYCIREGKGLEDLSLEEWRRFSNRFGEDIKEVVSVYSSLKSRDTEGGTAPRRVKAGLRAARRELDRMKPASGGNLSTKDRQAGGRRK